MIIFSNIINEALQNQGRTKQWLSDQINSQVDEKRQLTYKAFLDRLKRESLSAEQLVIICRELNIDINIFKKIIKKEIESEQRTI